MTAVLDEAVRTEWWRDLADSERRELIALWDRRAERIDYARRGDGFEPVPVRLVGRTVEPLDPADAEDAEYISTQLLEFILNHEDIAFFLKERKFHICRRHALAQNTLRQGYIPAEFQCEMAGSLCPIRQISRAVAGKRVHFRLEVLRAHGPTRGDGSAGES